MRTQFDDLQRAIVGLVIVVYLVLGVLAFTARALNECSDTPNQPAEVNPNYKTAPRSQRPQFAGPQEAAIFYVGQFARSLAYSDREPLGSLAFEFVDNVTALIITGDPYHQVGERVQDVLRIILFS